MLPQIRICKACARKFNAVTPDADTCLSCLSKPHKQSEPVDTEAVEARLKELDKKRAEEEIVASAPELPEDEPELPEDDDEPRSDKKPTKIIRRFGERTCDDCRKQYVPTAPRQVWCPTCGKKHASMKSKPFMVNALGPKLPEKPKLPDKPKVKSEPIVAPSTEARAEAILGILIQLNKVTPELVAKIDHFLREID
jgi:hypothetical protein